jgi:cyanophycinase
MPPWWRPLHWLLLPCVALAAAPAPACAQGLTIAIGGALQKDNTEVWSRVVGLAGGPGARFVVLSTASSEPVASAASIVARLQAHGAHAVTLPVSPDWPGVDPATAVADPELLAEVRRSQGVFLSGGAQARLLDTLAPGGRDSPLLQALKALWQRGGVVAGTSSGAAVLGTVVFRDVPDPAAVLPDPPARLREGVEVDRGFGLLPADVLVDQHFIKRGRLARLLPLMQLRGLSLGLGVEEDSAVVVQGHEVQALGRHGALVADLGAASPRSADSGAFRVRDAVLHWLQPGERFHLGERRPLAPPTPVPPSALSPAGEPTEAVARAFQANPLAPGVLPAAMRAVWEGRVPELRGVSRAPDGATLRDFEWRLLPLSGSPVASVRLEVTPLSPGRSSGAPGQR